MDLGRATVGIGRLAVWLGLGLLPAITACAGKSVSHGGSEDEGGGSGNGGDAGNTGRGGSSARGGTGTSGSAGKGGAASNIVVQAINERSADKIDLLFMVDNSISMANKQALLAEAVPVLMQRLMNPRCVDQSGITTGDFAPCPSGETPEFPPVEDIHIGVITSSLGSHGGEVCVNDPAAMPPRTLNDMAELLPGVRTGLYSYQGNGFLVWDPREERPPFDAHPGLSAHETLAADFVADFAGQINAAGERGCGYEASLEAWYRFLVDPEPISDASNNGQVTVRGLVNGVVLTQRALFLRPDSLLAIVMLTDENDCSILDENEAQGWLVGRRTQMPRGSDACSHPEDPDLYRCCIPCVMLDDPNFQSEPGCSYRSDIPCNSPGGIGHSLSTIEDSMNLRCYAQKRRFGIDLLYPVQRYVDALTAPRIDLRAGDPNDTPTVTNPIYTPGADGTPARDPSLVFLVGVVGVPWQDIAASESLGARGLTYLTAREMNAAAPNRWDVILGDPDSGRPPSDPFMIESIDERPAGAMNPIPGVSARISPSTDTARNPINGHEQNVVNRDDLQYACTFDLVPSVPCTSANADGCDCNESERAYNRPLCEYSEGARDGTQTHGKAYPSLRQLQVLKGFGDNAIVASACPKNTTVEGSASDDVDYGYNPAVHAMVDRFKEALGRRCLPRPLAADVTAGLPCAIVEARPPDGGSCTCDPSTGRSGRPSEEVSVAIEEELGATGYCGGAFPCSNYCLCEVAELSAGDRLTCQSDPVDPGGVHGFCYVDSQNGNPELLAGCPATEQQIIRFMGDGLPAPNARAFVACLGAAK